MSARTGVKELGLSSRSQTLELSMPPRLRSHAVTVVPTFAPHDDVDGLPQRHQPRVDKADDHDGGGGRALDDGRYAQTGQKADERLAGHLVEQRAQPAARAALQRRAHQAHAEQKQR